MMFLMNKPHHLALAILAIVAALGAVGIVSTISSAKEFRQVGSIQPTSGSGKGPYLVLF